MVTRAGSTRAAGSRVRSAAERDDLRVSRGSYGRAAAECGLPPQVQQALWDRLVSSAEPARLGVQGVAWYGGACVSLVAMGLFLGTSWASVGSGVGLALTLTYLVAFIAGCEALRARGHGVPAGLLAATAVALVPLAVFAAQETFGLWTERSFGDYDSFVAYVSGQWAVMEVATLAASVVVWRRYRTAFLLLPTAVAGWFLTMDLADAVGGDTGSTPASALVTAVLLGVALRLDHQGLRDEGFWLHLSGLASLTYLLGLLDVPTGARMLLVGLSGAACLAMAVWLARRVHLVFGAGYAFAALAYLAYEVFGGSPLFALVLGAIGVSIVVGGIRLDRAGTTEAGLSPAS